MTSPTDQTYNQRAALSASRRGHPIDDSEECMAAWRQFCKQQGWIEVRFVDVFGVKPPNERIAFEAGWQAAAKGRRG